MATEDSRYRQSTQYRLWSFSPSQLAELRSKTNQLATASISGRLSARNGGEGTSTPIPEFLTADEEQKLVTFYTTQLLRAAVFLELPTEERATAAVFFKRFYVTNSVMTYPPSTMIKTALFFGAKAEGFYMRVGKIAEKIKGTTVEEILAGEFLLCEGIRFAFDVRHPYRALEGAIMQLKALEDLDEKHIKAAHSRAREILKFGALVTDAYFHYTPSQIMLAALSLADRSLAERLIDESFKVNGAHLPKKDASAAGAPVPDSSGSKAARAKNREAERERIFGAEVRDKVMAVIQSCADMMSHELPERDDGFWSNEAGELFKPLTKRLKKCRDPDRSDLVALQKARRERALNSADSDDERDPGKKNKKATIEGDGSVFGGPVVADARDSKRRKVSNDPFGPPLARLNVLRRVNLDLGRVHLHMSFALGLLDVPAPRGARLLGRPPVDREPALYVVDQQRDAQHQGAPQQHYGYVPPAELDDAVVHNCHQRRGSCGRVDRPRQGHAGRRGRTRQGPARPAVDEGTEAEGRVVGRALQQPFRAAKDGGDDGSDEGADHLADDGVSWLGQRGLDGDEQHGGKDADEGPKDVNEIADSLLRPVWMSMANEPRQRIWQSVTRVPWDPWIQIRINVEVPFRELRCHCPGLCIPPRLAWFLTS
ncbi:hypothetical protein PspLS_09956 [Pyricularia sp. CBS 133598]|nr:hypothetical protein PspLS_09956 [Pyricularia sp. CBS 133598]